MSRIHNTGLKAPSGYFGEFKTTLNIYSDVCVAIDWQAIFQTEVQLFLIIRRSIYNFWISGVKLEGGQCLARRILNKKVHTLAIRCIFMQVPDRQQRRTTPYPNNQPVWRCGGLTDTLFCKLLEFMTNRWTKDKLCVVYKLTFSWGLYLFQWPINSLCARMVFTIFDAMVVS